VHIHACPVHAAVQQPAPEPPRQARLAPVTCQLIYVTVAKVLFALLL